MLVNFTMETARTEVTSIRRRNYIEKSTWRTHQYFVAFDSRIHDESSTSNRCRNFHVDLPFKTDENSTNFPRGISTSKQWRRCVHWEEDVWKESTQIIKIEELLLKWEEQEDVWKGGQARRLIKKFKEW